MMMPNEEIPASTWAFLKASRFWALTIGAVSIYLKAKGFIGEPEMYLIATITSGFVVVRTVDRASEQKVVAGVKAVEAATDAVTDKRT